MRNAAPPILAALVATSAVAQDQRFTVAIVRPDGALVPFAAYDAGRWERAWPEADEAIDVTSVDAVPSVGASAATACLMFGACFPPPAEHRYKPRQPVSKSSKRIVPVRSR